ncbi:MAG: glycosyltransferase [Sedimentisphaerales bacterium]|nr:glycosyltransferase [Sedimentisphaerales bacterium]
MHVAMVTVFPEGAGHIDGGVAGVAKYLVDELVKHTNVKLTIIVPKAHPGKTTCEQWPERQGLRDEGRGTTDAISSSIINRPSSFIYRVGKKPLWSFLPGTVYDIFAGRRQIKSLLRQINPDIVHFQNDTFLAANCAYPHVLTIHGIVERDAMWDNRWGAVRWFKWLLLKLTEEYGRRRVPNVILISEYAKNFLPKQNNIHKTWHIDNPIADSFFEVDWRFEPGRIFCCSRVRPLKNIVGMIKAFAVVSEQLAGARLHIAGAAKPGYLIECRQEAKANGLSDKVCFLGNLSIDDVQLELSKANCLAIPSFQENAPLTIAEAMAAGVPVVGARVGGIPEMVEHGQTGLLIDPYDTEGIAAAVLRILSDHSLAISMSQRAKEIANRRFMASAVCKQTLQVYDEILSNPT